MEVAAFSALSDKNISTVLRVLPATVGALGVVDELDVATVDVLPLVFVDCSLQVLVRSEADEPKAVGSAPARALSQLKGQNLRLIARLAMCVRVSDLTGVAHQVLEVLNEQVLDRKSANSFARNSPKTNRLRPGRGRRHTRKREVIASSDSSTSTTRHPDLSTDVGELVNESGRGGHLTSVVVVCFEWPPESVACVCAIIASSEFCASVFAPPSRPTRKEMALARRFCPTSRFAANAETHLSARHTSAQPGRNTTPLFAGERLLRHTQSGRYTSVLGLGRRIIRP